jgi:hypothetical protein
MSLRGTGGTGLMLLLLLPADWVRHDCCGLITCSTSFLLATVPSYGLSEKGHVGGSLIVVNKNALDSVHLFSFLMQEGEEEEKEGRKE